MLRALGMIGVSWRAGGKGSLAAFTLQPEEVEARLLGFARQEGLTELAYIATCNRVELVFVQGGEGRVGRDLRPQAYALLTGAIGGPDQLRQLKAWGGEGAMEHLFLTAAGLDSAMVGEVEIAGQVRTAWELSRRLGLCGPLLETLFDEALRVAATVRGETRVGAGRVSLAEIAVDLLKERLASANGQVALVGVSPMTERAAVSLHAAGIPFVVANRTPGRAEALAGRFGARAMSLDEFRAEPPAVEAVLSATGAATPLLDRAQIERLAARSPSGQPPLVVDMSIPPDFDPETCAACDVPRIDMQQISQRAEDNRAARLMEAAQARELVDQALTRAMERFVERHSGQLFRVLQQRYRRTAEEGVKRLFKKDLAHLNEREREAVETWAAALARRFAHIPCLGLRGLLHGGPEGSLEAFLDGLEPEFADELRGAMRASTATLSQGAAS